MTTKELCDFFLPRGATLGFDKPRISKHYICVPGRRSLAVGGEKKDKVQIEAFTDALHWHRGLFGGEGPLTLKVGSGSHTPAVLDAIATLHDALKERVELTVKVDHTPQKLTSPDFTMLGKISLARLESIGPTIPPEFVIKLAARMESCPVFRWYHTSSGKWSGRVDGLEVCTLDSNGDVVVLKVGDIGKKGNDGQARQLFRELTGQDIHRFAIAELGKAAQLIEKVAKDRECGQLADFELEHRIESLIIRGMLPIEVNGTRLVPAFQLFPFQFPAYWSREGSTKYIDVLMRSGKELWVVELKAPDRGQGRYLRQSVGQAVLYREFIRRAVPLHDWFSGHFNLDAANCQAVVVLPEPKGPQADSLRTDVLSLADLFDCKVAFFSWPLC